MSSFCVVSWVCRRWCGCNGDSVAVALFCANLRRGGYFVVGLCRDGNFQCEFVPWFSICL